MRSWEDDREINPIDTVGSMKVEEYRAVRILGKVLEEHLSSYSPEWRGVAVMKLASLVGKYTAEIESAELEKLVSDNSGYFNEAVVNGIERLSGEVVAANNLQVVE